jgi:predicted small metal-binding protein
LNASKEQITLDRAGIVESTIMIRFRCKDIDLKECEFQVQGDSREEIMEIAILHVGKTHRMVNITPQTRERIQRAVKG